MMAVSIRKLIQIRSRKTNYILRGISDSKKLISVSELGEIARKTYNGFNDTAIQKKQ